MKNILAINTLVTPHQCIYIQDNKEQVFDLTENNNLEGLLTSFNKLKVLNKDIFNELDLLWVINGPGAYTSTRVGVVIANTFAYALSIPIYIINSFSYLSLSSDEHADIYAIYAGKNEIAFIKNKQSKPQFLNTVKFEEYINEKGLKLIINKPKKIQININPSLIIDANNSINEIVQKSFKQSIGKEVSQCEAIYIREPEITKAKNKL